MGETEPKDSGLKAVFPYVGEAARIKTKKGLAPPLVSGTFGPLDASVLGSSKMTSANLLPKI
jgi:hypothetical protein